MQGIIGSFAVKHDSALGGDRLVLEPFRKQVFDHALPRAFIRQEVNVKDPRSRALFLSPDGQALLKALVAD